MNRSGSPLPRSSWGGPPVDDIGHVGAFPGERRDRPGKRDRLRSRRGRRSRWSRSWRCRSRWRWTRSRRRWNRRCWSWRRRRWNWCWGGVFLGGGRRPSSRDLVARMTVAGWLSSRVLPARVPNWGRPGLVPVWVPLPGRGTWRRPRGIGARRPRTGGVRPHVDGEGAAFRTHDVGIR